MGFDFGQFLGGMSRQISTNIEEAKRFNREKEFRMDMLAEEEATKMRLAKAAERREKQRQDKENAALLKSMGISDAKAGWILKGGSAAVSQYVDYSKAALARGINPDDMLESSMFVEDHNDPRNEAAMMATVRNYDTVEPFTVRQDIMTSVLGEVEEPKAPKQYSSLEAGHAGTYSLLQNAKSVYASDPSKANQDEVTRLEDVLEEWKTKIEEDIALRKPEDKPDKPIEYFSKTSRETIKKNAFADAYTEYDFETDINGNITANLEGRQGAKIVARIAAANTIEAQAKVADDVVDSNLLNEADRIREKALDALTNYGQAIVAQSGGAENSPTKKFGYLKSTKENPDNNYQMHVKGNSGGYKIGDVVVAEEPDGSGGMILKVYVYTGMKDPNDNGYEDSTGRVLFNYFHDAGRLY
tara:strand:+ start:1139 stop:2380 length:1242 start_codon:yes stop_codon:yes gene_type:complete